jgi:dihydrofolate reductase
VNSVEEALEFAKNNGEEEAFIIGGARIYEAALPYLDRIYYTEVDLEPEGDTQFLWKPNDQWQKTFSEGYEVDEKNKIRHTFSIFEKQFVL